MQEYKATLKLTRVDLVVLLLVCSAKLWKQPPSEAWTRGVGVTAQEKGAAECVWGEGREMLLFSAEKTG